MFVVDIYFDNENADSRQLLHNEIFPLFTEKHKAISKRERFVYQLTEQYSERDKGIPHAY